MTATTPTAIIGYLRAVEVADTAGLASVLLDDAEVEDRRQVKPVPFDDAPGLVERLGVIGDNTFDVRLVAVRDERCALVRVIIDRSSGAESDTVVVVRTTSDGAKLDRVVVFDLDDIVEAFDELTDLYIAGLEPARAEVVRLGARCSRAALVRDLDDLQSLLAPDFRTDDHRIGLQEEHVGQRAYERMEAVLTDDEELLDVITEIHAVSEHGLLVTRTQASRKDLGRAEGDLLLCLVRGGKVAALEFYDAVDIDRAMHRLASLAPREE